MRNIASLVLNCSTLLGGSRSSRVNGRTLREGNCKLLLCASLLIAALQVQATNAANGVFSVSATKTVQFGDANETSSHTLTSLMTWLEAVAKESNGWQLLEQTEWRYLLSRENNAGKLLIAGAKVDGHYGLILLPDGWTDPTGTLIHGSSAEAYEQTITAARWSELAKTGAVFLPCQGYSSDGTNYAVIDPATHGAYWMKSEDGDKAYRLQADADGTLADNLSFAKTMYYSVILAKAVKSISENDEQDAFDTKIAALRSETQFYLHRSLYKDGYFNTLCLPFNVASIAGSPLAGAEVFTFASATVEDDVLRLDIRPVTNDRLEKGVPYLIRWASGTDIMTPMQFTLSSTADWDDDDQAGTDPGSTDVKYHGFYYKTHLADAVEYVDPDDYEHLVVKAHYNFFLGAENNLYWPTDGGTESAKMKGFRAHFYIVTGTTPTGGPSHAPSKGMRAVLRITDSATGVENVQSEIVPCSKLLRDGQIVLIINGQPYSIGGQKL